MPGPSRADEPAVGPRWATPRGTVLMALNTELSNTRPERTPPDAKTDLLLALARALHKVGLPAHRLEATLHAAGCSARRAAANHDDADRALDVVRLWRGTVDLCAACARPAASTCKAGRQLTALARDLDRGTVEVGEARRRARRNRASMYLLGPAGDRGRLCAERRRVRDLLWRRDHRTVGGAGRRPGGRLRGGGAAQSAGVVATVRAGGRLGRRPDCRIDRSCPLGSFADWVPLAAGLIILLPGIMLVDATEELAQGHLVAGSSRMAGVGVVFLAMTIGVLLGLKVTEFIPSPPAPRSRCPCPSGPGCRHWCWWPWDR